MHLKTRVSLFAILAAFGVMGPAQATCSMQTTPIVLGAYDPLASIPAPVLVSVNVSCTQDNMISVAIGKGNGQTYDHRELRMGSQAVKYNIYTGATTVSVWGDGTQGTQTQSAMVPSGQTVQIVGNARLVPGQNPQPGSYTDSLIFTMVF